MLNDPLQSGDLFPRDCHEDVFVKFTEYSSDLRDQGVSVPHMEAFHSVLKKTDENDVVGGNAGTVNWMESSTGSSCFKCIPRMSRMTRSCVIEVDHGAFSVSRCLLPQAFDYRSGRTISTKNVVLYKLLLETATRPCVPETVPSARRRIGSGLMISRALFARVLSRLCLTALPTMVSECQNRLSRRWTSEKNETAPILQSILYTTVFGWLLSPSWMKARDTEQSWSQSLLDGGEQGDQILRGELPVLTSDGDTHITSQDKQVLWKLFRHSYKWLTLPRNIWHGQ
jgi:hypothetical protein